MVRSSRCSPGMERISRYLARYCSTRARRPRRQGRVGVDGVAEEDEQLGAIARPRVEQDEGMHGTAAGVGAVGVTRKGQAQIGGGLLSRSGGKGAGLRRQGAVQGGPVEGVGGGGQTGGG